MIKFKAIVGFIGILCSLSVFNGCNQKDPQQWTLEKESFPGNLSSDIGMFISDLGSADKAVRRNAKLRLKNIKNPEVIPALIQCLEHKNPKIRAGCAEILGETADCRAVEPLKKVIQSAQKISGPFGFAGDSEPPGSASEVESDLESSLLVYMLAAKSLGNLKCREATDAIITLLGNSKNQVVLHAVWAAKESKSPALVKALIHAHETADCSIKSEILKTLGLIGGEIAVDYLIDALKDDFRGTRVTAAIALGWTGDVRAVTPLIHALDKDDESLQRNALTSLGFLKDDRICGILQSYLNNPNRKLRFQTTLSLGKHPECQAVDALISLLQDTDHSI